MSRIICVCNHKGGVGKTTITANIGFSLARYFKVLLIDMDPQGNLSSGLGVTDPDENIGVYMKGMIHSRFPVPEPAKINRYVHIIPGDENLIEIDSLLNTVAGGEFLLKRVIERIKSNYDILLIDCPPSFNMLTINALNCSSLILIPVKPEKFSIDGIRLIENFAHKKQIPYKIIFNQVNNRVLYHQQIMDITTGRFNGNILKHSVRNTIYLSEAFGHAKDIFHYKSKSIGAQDFVDVTNELVNYI